MGRILIGAWDCKYCNKKAIPGNVRECPGCGNPRGEDVKFYLPSDAKPVKDETKVSREPDWLCSYCNTFNPFEEENCISCGHAREDSDIDYFQHHKMNSLKRHHEETNSIHAEDDGEFFSSDEYDKERISLEDSCEDNQHIESSNKGKSKIEEIKDLISVGCDKLSKISKAKILICLATIAVVIFSIIAIAVPRTETMQVERVIWEYSMDIERYQTVNESDWFLPNNARLQRTATEIHHYESVIDHYQTKSRQVSEQVIVGYEEEVVGYRDLGNGYFEEITSQKPIYETRYKTEYYEEPVYRQEPVYKTKYYYEIEKWLYVRTEYSEGFDKNTYWPEVELEENERVSNKDSKYFVQVTNEDQKSEKISVKYDEWCEIEEGDEVTVKKWIFYKKIIFD